MPPVRLAARKPYESESGSWRGCSISSSRRYGTLTTTVCGRPRRMPRKRFADWTRHIVIHVLAAIMCAGILTVTIIEKFRQGAWLTLVITGAAIALCLLVRRHYRRVSSRLAELNAEFEDLPSVDHEGGAPDPAQPTAVLLVGNAMTGASS